MYLFSEQVALSNKYKKLNTSRHLIRRCSMRKDKKEFVLFLKTLKSGEKIYYYVTRDENNRRLQYSTGESDQQKALQVCLDRMAKGKLIPNSRLSFSDYAKDFYDYDKSPYIQGRVKRGFNYKRSSAVARDSFIKKEAIPFFKDKLITLISPGDIERFVMKLKEKAITNTTLNFKINALKLVFNYAYKMGDINFNPVNQIMLFKKDTREKGFFKKEEVDRLFENSSIEKNWDNNLIIYTINLLAVHTGCRLGELQALPVQDLNLHESCIEIKHSWNDRFGLGSTKTGKNRIIPVSKELIGKLLNLSWGKDDEDFVFSDMDGKTPIARHKIYAQFKKTLCTIGITEEERQKRNLSFHSWRHTFASNLANDNVPELYIRRLTGHSSTQILDVYSHVQVEKLRTAINV